jgi:hypothetical protein
VGNHVRVPDVPLPELPPALGADSLRDLDDPAIATLLDELAAFERETVTAMSPFERRLKEIRARRGELATERRRRERAASVAARAAVRAAVKSGERPTLAEALAAAGSEIAEATPLADVAANLSTGGEVDFGYPARPGRIGFTDGRQLRNAATWGEARRLWADGWEPGSPGIPGVRVHLKGTRVERVVPADEIVVGQSSPAPSA